MKKLLLILGLICGFNSFAQAAVLFEPYLGYEMGKFEPATKISGTVMGARLAYFANNNFWIGADILQSLSEQVQPEDLEPITVKRSTTSLVLGYNTNGKVRLWAALGLSHSMMIEDGKLEGQQQKFGLGYLYSRNVSFNLEMLQDKFDKMDGASADLKGTSYILSVSFPFKL